MTATSGPSLQLTPADERLLDELQRRDVLAVDRLDAWRRAVSQEIARLSALERWKAKEEAS